MSKLQKFVAKRRLRGKWTLVTLSFELDAVKDPKNSSWSLYSWASDQYVKGPFRDLEDLLADFKAERIA